MPIFSSISAFLAIMSNVAWFNQLLSSSLDSQEFLSFLKKLVWWIKNKGRFSWDRVIVILDNWPSHTAGSVNNFFASADYLVFYLSRTAHSLRPWRRPFRRWRWGFRGLAKSEHWKLQSVLGLNQLHATLKQMEKNEVRSYFWSLSIHESKSIWT